MIRNDRTIEYDSQRVMLVVITALTPCFMMGVYVFGLDMLDKMLGGCGLAVLLAWLMRKAAAVRASKSESAAAIRASKPGSSEGAERMDAAGAKRPGHEPDNEPDLLAAVITGAIIVFGLPSTMPIYAVFIGVAIAMVPGRFIVDRLLQSLEHMRRKSGNNGCSERFSKEGAGAGTAGNSGRKAAYILERAVITAAAAQTALWLLFRDQMNTWPLNDFVETRVQPGDVATGLTPLQILAEGGDLPGLSRMFVGFISGPCGEVSVAAAVIGGVYLIWKKIISPWIPVCVLGTIFAAAYVYYVTAGAGIAAVAAHNGAAIAALGPGDASSTAVYLAFYQILSGGAVFGAFFLAPAICLCGTELIPVVKTHTAEAETYQKPVEKSDTEKTVKYREVNRGNLLLQIIYAAGVGFITMIFRTKGIFVEGIAAPVLIMYIAAYIAAAAVLSAWKRPQKSNEDNKQQ